MSMNAVVVAALRGQMAAERCQERASPEAID
jgi:hypothetical protein